jgi:Fe-S cluster biogenesis protein NfuA
MATAASQPYIAKLGFSDPDRSKDRHGLACEYLFERLLELEVGPTITQKQKEYLNHLYSKAKEQYDEIVSLLNDDQGCVSWRGHYYSRADITTVMQGCCDCCTSVNSALNTIHDDYGRATAKATYCLSACVSKPIKTGYQGKHTAGFADVLLAESTIEPLVFDPNRLYYPSIISPCILGEVKITKQSAETVLQQINYYRQHIEGGVDKVYILTDYDCSDLQRITQGSDIHVYRLGRRFEDWIASRAMPSTPEL